jgi:hypothetical protein
MEANSAAAPVHINWRRFIMVDSPYRWITLEYGEKKLR